MWVFVLGGPTFLSMGPQRHPRCRFAAERPASVARYLRTYEAVPRLALTIPVSRIENRLGANDATLDS